MRLTPTSPSVATSLAASCWNSISLPTRRTHSPVEPSRGAEDGEAHPGLLQDADEGARDLLAARVERHRRADVEEIVEPRGLGGVVHDRHAEPGAQSPRCSAGRPQGLPCDLVGLEQLLQLVRELAGDHHLVLAHAEELVEVLELDRARRLAVAAGRAGPERLVGDHGADQRRQLVASGRPRRSPRAARPDGA